MNAGDAWYDSARASEKLAEKIGIRTGLNIIRSYVEAESDYGLVATEWEFGCAGAIRDTADQNDALVKKRLRELGLGKFL
jgi:hypothetical protein